MAVSIRLRRMGSKKRPFYRLIAADSRMPRDGRFLEELGYYHPIEKPAKVSLVEERIFYWLESGATPSDTVASLFKEVGLSAKWSKKKNGEDVSEIEIKSVITERTKKKKVKKAE
ncbi:MAG: 30S ribosomal protein S16 [candidate division Zixibacteria bacterium]